ncbi:MAG TPA: hypothetical protein VIL97_09275, partial [Thermoanaerobaculia bacterium]
MRRVFRTALGLCFLLSLLPFDLHAMRHPDASDHAARRPREINTTSTANLIGRIVDENGTAVAGIYTWLASASNRQFAYESDQIYTGTDGVFTMSGIADGDYFLNAYADQPNLMSVDTWFPDVWDFDFHRNLRAATPIRFTSGNTNILEMKVARGTRFRFELRNAAGQLIDLTSQDPPCSSMSGLNLGSMYSDSGATPLLYPITFNCLVFTRRSAGNYVTVPIPLGRKVWMQLWPDGTDFLPVFHDGKMTVGESAPLVATSAGESSVPVTLTARGPSISGTARFQSTTLLTILQRNVRLYQNGFLIRINSLAPDGSATLGGIPDGDYKVQYFVRGRNQPSPAANYSKFYQNASALAGATTISVRGQNVTGINAFLDTPPDLAQVGGDWSGTFSDSISCGGTTFTSSGTASFTLTQSGTNVNGSGTLFDRKNISGSCAASGTTTIVGSIFGTLNGNAFAGTFATSLGNLSLTGGFGSGTFTGTLTYPNGTSLIALRSGSAARIESFLASPTRIRLGESSTLTWRTSNAVTVAISNVSTSLPASGSVTVTPIANTTYTLTAGSSTTPPTALATVEVQTLPAISVVVLPDALVQLPDASGATTTYTLLNAGGAASSISLGQSGTFFTQEPSSFTLAAGASQTVTIRSTQQEPGSYEGGSTPSGPGVPDGLSIALRLLVAAPPSSGTVSAESTTSRVDVAAPPEEEQLSGSISFTNSGSATLTGI